MSGLSGNVYGIKIGGEHGDFVDCEISADITTTRDMISKSGSHGGQYKHFRYGYYSWSVSMSANSVVSALKGSFNKLMEAQKNGDTIELLITSRVSNTQLIDIWGDVLIPNLNLVFPNTGASTYTVSFQGTGVLNTEFGEIGYLTTDLGTYITDELNNKIQVIKNI